MSIAIPKPSSLPDMPQESNMPEESDVPQEQPDFKLPSQDDLNLNHEQRIQALEAALMRIRGAI